MSSIRPRPIAAIIALFLSGCGLLDFTENTFLVAPTAISVPTVVRPGQDLVVEVAYLQESSSLEYSVQIEGSGTNYLVSLRVREGTPEPDDESGQRVVPFNIGNAMAGEYVFQIRRESAPNLRLSFPVTLDSLARPYRLRANGHRFGDSVAADTLVLGLYTGRRIGLSAPPETALLVRDGERFTWSGQRSDTELYFDIVPADTLFGTGALDTAFRITALAPEREIRFLNESPQTEMPIPR